MVLIGLLRRWRTLHGHLLHKGLGRLQGLLEGGYEIGSMGVKLGLVLVLVLLVVVVVVVMVGG